MIKKFGWVIKNGKHHRIRGVKWMRDNFSIETKSCVEITVHDLQKSHKAFKAFCLAAFAVKEVKQYGRYQKSGRKSRVSLRDNSITRYRPGKFALSLFNQKLTISTAEASRLRCLAAKNGWIKVFNDYDRSYGTILLKDIKSFKIGNPEVSHKIRIGDFNGKKYAYVLDTPILRNVSIRLTSRSTRYRSSVIQDISIIKRRHEETLTDLSLTGY